jgi:hypothetical protein
VDFAMDIIMNMSMVYIICCIYLLNMKVIVTIPLQCLVKSMCIYKEVIVPCYSRGFSALLPWGKMPCCLGEECLAAFWRRMPCCLLGKNAALLLRRELLSLAPQRTYSAWLPRGLTQLGFPEDLLSLAPRRLIQLGSPEECKFRTQTLFVGGVFQLDLMTSVRILCVP